MNQLIEQSKVITMLQEIEKELSKLEKQLDSRVGEKVKKDEYHLVKQLLNTETEISKLQTFAANAPSNSNHISTSLNSVKTNLKMSLQKTSFS
ncbi:hypothetical protein [Metabacillus arenae]|uniref:Uncharacterized protein n=1 Tax=Metabacillus arenae TaxID=2771434 RepID=A0A926RYY6_9BACI|nr:hypothetical protein [Metabacillus arenae]MBD1381662.1 hypothetical protein [Metabacillus arenae]